MPFRRLWLSMATLTVLSACSDLSGFGMVGRTSNMALPDGPPIEDIVTQFDDALGCLRGSVPRGITFAVGQIVDSTGRESYADGATGRFVSQGSAEMVQSALFRAGLSVVNRRDPNITVVETQWGIRDIQLQIPVNFYVSGSINSLDFLPGGGVDIQIGGVGPRYRQSRILIGLDLTLTDAFTGRIVANVPLQRQIFSTESGASVGRFFDTTLVTIDAGRQEREAVHFVLRQMLSLATFELLSQLSNPMQHAQCRQLVDPFYGNLRDTQRGDPYALAEALTVAEQVADRRRTEQAATAPLTAPDPTRTASADSARATQSIEAQIRELATQASIFGARAIAAAEESLAAPTAEQAAQKAALAMELMAGSVQLLRRGAELGLSGPEGDAAAVVVERAVTLTQQAAVAVSARAQAAPDAAGTPAAPAPAAPGPATPPVEAAPSRATPVPGTPDAQRLGLP